MFYLSVKGEKDKMYNYINYLKLRLRHILVFCLTFSNFLPILTLAENIAMHAEACGKMYSLVYV